MRQIKYEIEQEDRGVFIVYIDDEKERLCETWAEALLWASKDLHELALLELQERINVL